MEALDNFTTPEVRRNYAGFGGRDRKKSKWIFWSQPHHFYSTSPDLRGTRFGRNPSTGSRGENRARDNGPNG